MLHLTRAAESGFLVLLVRSAHELCSQTLEPAAGGTIWTGHQFNDRVPDRRGRFVGRLLRGGCGCPNKHNQHTCQESVHLGKPVSLALLFPDNYRVGSILPRPTGFKELYGACDRVRLRQPLACTGG